MYNSSNLICTNILKNTFNIYFLILKVLIYVNHHKVGKFQFLLYKYHWTQLLFVFYNVLFSSYNAIKQWILRMGRGQRSIESVAFSKPEFGDSWKRDNFSKDKSENIYLYLFTYCFLLITAGNWPMFSIGNWKQVFDEWNLFIVNMILLSNKASKVNKVNKAQIQ